MPIASDVLSPTNGPKQLSDGNSAGTVMGQSGVMPDGPADKISFYGATPIVQPVAPGNVHTVAAGATTAVYTNTTFDGGTGTTAYTVGDVVLALKKLGLIAV